MALPVLLLCACTDRDALTPELPKPDDGLASIECHVNVAKGAMTCAPPATFRTARGVNAAIHTLGGQEEYVKLASSGTSYDTGTQILQSSVTVQNLTQQVLGTDGVTSAGLMVFFQSPPATTGGSGMVGVANEDGTQTFNASGQEYFLYNQTLAPFEISSAKTWQFSVPNTVTTFTFTLYVYTQSTGSNAASLMDRVWSGLASSAWLNPGNWVGGSVPTGASTVAIPADSLMAGDNQPVLSADTAVTNLRVGFGSTLGLGGFTLEARGNVDAVGTISNGTLWLSGSGALLGGNVPSLKVSGRAELQSATKATGAVSVQDGSLNANGQPLSIQIP